VNVCELEQTIKTLAAIEESTSPVVSCYLDIQSGVACYGAAFEERVHLLRKSLSGATLTGFGEAINRIESFLKGELKTGTAGVAIFARSGPTPLFMPLQFRARVPTWVAIGPWPNLYHLVELKDNYDRYVVLLANETGSRIIGINLGAATEQIWLSAHPELRSRVGREWSRDHFQDHRRAKNHQLVQEQIRVLERLLSGSGYSHLVLAGSRRITAEIRKALPKSISSKLVDVVRTSSSDRLSNIVASTLNSFLRHEELESQAIAQRLVEQIHTHGLAVAGTEQCLRAVSTRQSDCLVILQSYEPGQGGQCSHCGWSELKRPIPADCPGCGRSVRSFDIKAEMVRLAELSDCHIEVVEHSETLKSLGGVGCLLRYVAPERYGTAAA
jgi:hypothetical protein